MTLHDLIFVVCFAVVAPLIDYGTFWQAFQRLSRLDPAFTRRWLWKSAVSNPWLLVALGAAIWIASDRSWASFGFTVPEGWRLWAAVALILLLVVYHGLAIASLASNAEARAALRRQMGQVEAVLPRTRGDVYWFAGVSVTAGFCEEFLYRGYFLWTFSPWLGWWGAAVVSLLCFSIGHAYQGWAGVLKTAVFGAIFTGMVALTGSLWPAIAVHTLTDLGSGIMSWLALREVSDAVELGV